MTAAQIEALGDEFLNSMNNENMEIAEDLYSKIKSLSEEEKKYLKLYMNTKMTLERGGFMVIFAEIRKSLDLIFKELRIIKEKAFGK